jgi:C-terminal processing protease CtpA/Prc
LFFFIKKSQFSLSIPIFISITKGIRVGDYITKINDTPADTLTLLDAQTEIQESGRHLQLTVKG